MNTFSKYFTKKFVSDYKQYAEYIDSVDVLSDGSINILVPSPSVEDLNVLISTELEEIIIGYDGAHWHFDTDKLN